VQLIILEQHLDKKYPSHHEKDHLAGQDYDGVTQELHDEQLLTT
jgi:hypothetical protein